MQTYRGEFCVYILAPSEIPLLKEMLERLVSDEELRRQAGTKARDWALQVFTPQAYVSVFEELSEQFLQAKPYRSERSDWPPARCSWYQAWRSRSC